MTPAKEAEQKGSHLVSQNEDLPLIRRSPMGFGAGNACLSEGMFIVEVEEKPLIKRKIEGKGGLENWERKRKM